MNSPLRPDPATDLTVVLPAYNEAERGLEPRLREVFDYLRCAYPNHDLLVVDDGSADATPLLLQDLARTIPTLRTVRLESNSGKGAAVRAGLLHSRGRRVVFMDADLATPLRELPRLLDHLAEGIDLVIGSRGLPESVLLQRESRLREWCGKLYNRLTQWLVLPGIMDTQCGFKGFQGDAARALAPALQESRFGFDVELLCLARAAGLRILEMPLEWAHQPGSRLHFLRDGFSMLRALLRIAWRQRRGTYDPAVQAIRKRLRDPEDAGLPADSQPRPGAGRKGGEPDPPRSPGTRLP